jgi:hypothetical protein
MPLGKTQILRLRTRPTRKGAGRKIFAGAALRMTALGRLSGRIIRVKERERHIYRHHSCYFTLC